MRSTPPMKGTAVLAVVQATLTVLAVLAGGRAEALPAVGTAASWGANALGQLGNGTTTGTSTPGTVNGLTDVAAVAAGGPPGIGDGGHTLALRKNGSVWAWGQNNLGQLGDGCTINVSCAHRSTPAQVIGLANVIAVAAGRGHSLALLADGHVKAWGRNDSGQLGNGSTTPSSTPVSVVPSAIFLGARAIAAGGRHSLAVLISGWTVHWRLGPQRLRSARHRRAADGLPAAQDGHRAHRRGRHRRGRRPQPGSAPGRHGLGLGLQQQRLARGRLPDRRDLRGRLRPPAVVGLPGAVAVAGGATWSMALTKTGEVWTWGWNAYGQLGNGCTISVNCVDSSVPAPVPGLTGVVAIAAGPYHAVAVTADGLVWTWGANGNGQLGDGCALGVTCVDSSVPLPVLQVFPTPKTVPVAAGYWNTYVAFPPLP